LAELGAQIGIDQGSVELLLEKLNLSRLTPSCTENRQKMLVQLLHCAENLDWRAIWNEIKMPFITCVRNRTSLDYIRLTTAVAYGYGEIHFPSLDSNLEDYLVNASRNVLARLRWSVVEPQPPPPLTDECRQNFTLGKNLNVAPPTGSRQRRTVSGTLLPPELQVHYKPRAVHGLILRILNDSFIFTSVT
jgi:hypothetical protein